MWNKTTNEGATIKDALDFAMTISASTSKEGDYASELYPNIAAVASVYGDPDGKYATFLSQAEPQFVQEPHYLWNQPFAEKEGLAANPSDSGDKTTGDGIANKQSATTKGNGAMSQGAMNNYGLYSVILSYFVYLLM